MTAGIDPWFLGILLAGLLLPELFRLVSEEIGERKKLKKTSKMAIAAVICLGLYIGLRYEMHSMALQQLASVDYHGHAPLVAAAFPDPSSPFAWRGVVDTANTIEEVNLTVGPGGIFDPDSSLTHFKPATSPALDAARNARLARLFLSYARFPLANPESLPDGYRVTIRDARFAASADSPSNLAVEIVLGSALNVRSQSIQFAKNVAEEGPSQ